VQSDGIAEGGGTDSTSEDENPNTFFLEKAVRRKNLRTQTHLYEREADAGDDTHDRWSLQSPFVNGESGVLWILEGTKAGTFFSFF
jgi:hypothetical protein